VSVFEISTSKLKPQSTPRVWVVISASALEKSTAAVRVNARTEFETGDILDPGWRGHPRQVRLKNWASRAETAGLARGDGWACARRRQAARDEIRACADVREGCEVGLGRARDTNQLGLWGDFSTSHLVPRLLWSIYYLVWILCLVYLIR